MRGRRNSANRWRHGSAALVTYPGSWRKPRPHLTAFVAAAMVGTDAGFPAHHGVRLMGTVPLSRRPTGLPELQRPLRDLYLTAAGIGNDACELHVTATGLRVIAGGRQQFHPFRTIALWAAVKCVLQTARNRSLHMGFVPIDAPASDAQNRQLLSAVHPTALLRLPVRHPPLFLCVMRHPGRASGLSCYVFECGGSVQAVSIATSLYRALHHSSPPPAPPTLNRSKSFSQLFLNFRKSKRRSPPPKPLPRSQSFVQVKTLPRARLISRTSIPLDIEVEDNHLYEEINESFVVSETRVLSDRRENERRWDPPISCPPQDFDNVLIPPVPSNEHYTSAWECRSTEGVLPGVTLLASANNGKNVVFSGQAHTKAITFLKKSAEMVSMFEQLEMEQQLRSSSQSSHWLPSYYP